MLSLLLDSMLLVKFPHINILKKWSKRLKKQENSCDRKKVRATFGAFRSALELELSAIIAKQEVTPRATLEAREAALKAERAEKRKANKQAKKAQAKSTTPDTLPNMDEISVCAIK